VIKNWSLKVLLKRGVEQNFHSHRAPEYAILLVFPGKENVTNVTIVSAQSAILQTTLNDA
jgi:hypothetical protein